jgi:hypothetical protein
MVGNPQVTLDVGISDGSYAWSKRWRRQRMVDPKAVPAFAEPREFPGGLVSTPPGVNPALTLESFELVGMVKCCALLIEVMNPCVEVPNEHSPLLE